MGSKLVVIDKRLIDARQWRADKLYVYALDCSTIGISPKVIDEWEECALFRAAVPCLETPAAIRFELPERLYNFYLLGQKGRRLTVAGQGAVALLTVTRGGGNG